MNLYARLSHVKEELGIDTAASDGDAQRLRVLERASRSIDGYVRPRHFYARQATVVVDGPGLDRLWMADDPTEPDIISLTSVKLDADADGVFEATLTADTDYWLWPVNRRAHTPATRIDINPSSAYRFPRGRRSVQLVGTFGYSVETELAGTTAEALDTSETDITMTAGHTVEAGETILIGAEQMYVSAVTANTLTVLRAQNGSTAASADTAASVYRRVYPEEIVQATQLQATRWLWNAQRGYAGPLADAEGEAASGRMLYAQIRDLVQGFAKLVSG